MYDSYKVHRFQLFSFILSLRDNILKLGQVICGSLHSACRRKVEQKEAQSANLEILSS